MGKHKDKSKKHKKEKKKHRSRSSSSSPLDEWVEKDNLSSYKEEINTKSAQREANISSKRDDWMSLPTTFLTESTIDRRKNKEENKKIEREREQYNPREHVRELNPYWKGGGDGLPKFKKPEDNPTSNKYESLNRYKSTSNWRKKRAETSVSYESTTERIEITKTDTFDDNAEILTDKGLNILASKLVKAEILGKTEQVKELKAKLEASRKQREESPKDEEVILLTQSDSKGQSRPVKFKSTYGEYSDTQKKKRKVETHQGGERVRYFPDDDKYSLQQMFENEKYNTVEDQNNEFMKMAGKVRKNDDLEDIFTDNARKKESGSKIDRRNRDRAINQHQKVIQSIDNCRLCLQSETMVKHLMITICETAFLSLPSHEPLTKGHCFIVPIRHVTCSTLLDENEWEDIMNFRKALTKMFSAKNEDVIFFETAKNLNRYPHMYIECIPVDREEGGTAPIYFKKAIDECEAEWAQNKKLVSLKDRNVRRAIPKGLSYFFVSFGMEEGFAHVIEDEKSFPNNFAQEIIGGMLDLHHSKWRKPKQQNFEEQSRRVVEFTKDWDFFDWTKT